jgi:hypothetical protein
LLTSGYYGSGEEDIHRLSYVFRFLALVWPWNEGQDKIYNKTAFCSLLALMVLEQFLKI